MYLSQHALAPLVSRALAEDVGTGDVTTLALIPADATAMAHIITREACVVAGLPLFDAVYRELDPTVCVTHATHDGARLAPGATLATVQGSARAILTGERVALNFVQRMCGIATRTAQYVAAMGDLPTRLLDTRKTTPGLRLLEKYAVRMGGGVNHRTGLYDAIMVKDNHRALLHAQGTSLPALIAQAKAYGGPLLAVEVEVETVADAVIAAEAGADVILLDNMPPPLLREAVAAVGGRVPLEASGNITLETIRAVAEAGVDYVSSGAITYAARAIDLSMELVTESSAQSTEEQARC